MIRENRIAKGVRYIAANEYICAVHRYILWITIDALMEYK